MKHILVFTMLGVICGCVMGVVLHRMSAVEQSTHVVRHGEPSIVSEAVAPPSVSLPTVAAESAPVLLTAQTPKRNKPAKSAGSKHAAIVLNAPVVAGDPIYSEPVARVALNYVGMDADAEAVWVSAINDPSLSSHDRQNLIEDLNENGISDPDHPTADDLPLIESRISLIESLAPESMDEVNYAAFQEAYKDLWNMHDQLVAR